MIIIGVALSIIAIVCGAILILYGIVDTDDDYTFWGHLFRLAS